MIDRPQPLDGQHAQAVAHAVADHHRAGQHRRRHHHADGNREIRPAEVPEILQQ